MERACLKPRCPRFAIPGGRGYCAAHRQTTSERGYGVLHQRERDQLRRTLPAPCIYCRILIGRTEEFDAAHFDDRDSASPRGVAHPLCNQRAKAGQLQPRIAVGAS